MSTKRIICTTIAFASYLLFTAFNMNCTSQLTNDVDASTAEFNRDKDWCDNNAAPLTDMCLQEAEASFNSNVDKNIADYDACML